VDGSVGQNSQFEYDTFWDTQPVKADERGSHMLSDMLYVSFLSVRPSVRLSVTL